MDDWRDQAADAKERKKTTAARKSVNLALHGGGAHGAFTWGVLDHLAEDERIVIDGISATSAGGTTIYAAQSGVESGGRDLASGLSAMQMRRIGCGNTRSIDLVLLVAARVVLD